MLQEARGASNNRSDPPPVPSSSPAGQQHANRASHLCHRKDGRAEGQGQVGVRAPTMVLELPRQHGCCTRPSRHPLVLRVAFIPFITAGDPDMETTEAAVRLLDSIGADVIELGVPYSVRFSLAWWQAQH